MSDERDTDAVGDAARRAARRDRMGASDPEPSLGARLGQIGILGWAITTPILLGLVAGRFGDRVFGTGIMLTAAGIILGAAIGFHAAWRWMHRQ
jgi:ATP synthase protein I